MAKIKLSKPFEHRGATHTELDLDLESLTGADIIRIEAELHTQGKVNVMGERSLLFQARIAAAAAKIPGELIEGLSARDFARVSDAVNGFLFAPGSSSDTDEQPAADTERTEPPQESCAESPPDSPEQRPTPP